MRASKELLLLACLLSASGGVQAQATMPVTLQHVSVGSRIRVVIPSIRRDRFIGRVDSLNSGEMVLDTAGTRRRLGFEMGPVLVEQYRRVRLQTSGIERIDVSGGRTTRASTLKGILFGGLAGAVLLGFGQMPEVNPSFQDFLEGAPAGLAVGAVLGGVVGFALGGEKWLPAEVPR